MNGSLHSRYHAPGSVRALPAGDRNASAAEGEWVRSVAEAYVESFRAELLGAYRWTDFSANVRVDASRYRVHVIIRALLENTATRFARGLRSLLNPRWNVVLTMITPGHIARWWSLTERVTPVWREWPGAVSSPSLSTELVLSDGPVMALAETRSGTLVRAADGTVGWVTDSIDDRACTTGPRLPVRRNDWGSVARSFLGVSYKPGGATPDGFDCSGLTQRIYREVLGLTIPRHSSDQFASGLGHAHPPRDGRLAFIERPGGLLHVGVVIRSRHYGWSVVHASSTRSMVVEDPFESYATLTERS